MDVDSATGYFQPSRVPPTQVVTVETRIKPENKGFALLAKMGWTEGQPLGLSGDGMSELLVSFWPSLNGR
jgi:hypothetical protein